MTIPVTPRALRIHGGRVSARQPASLLRGLRSARTPTEPVASTVSDEFLTLFELSCYCKISPRQLRRFLALPPGQALPCYRPGRNKVLVKRAEFDAWFAQFRTRGKAIVTQVLRELGLDPLRDWRHSAPPVARSHAAPSANPAVRPTDRTG